METQGREHLRCVLAHPPIRPANAEARHLRGLQAVRIAGRVQPEPIGCLNTSILDDLLPAGLMPKLDFDDAYPRPPLAQVLRAGLITGRAVNEDHTGHPLPAARGDGEGSPLAFAQVMVMGSSATAHFLSIQQVDYELFLRTLLQVKGHGLACLR